MQKSQPGAAQWDGGTVNERVCVERAVGKPVTTGGTGCITHPNGVAERGATAGEQPQKPRKNQGRHG